MSDPRHAAFAAAYSAALAGQPLDQAWLAFVQEQPAPATSDAGQGDQPWETPLAVMKAVNAYHMHGDALRLNALDAAIRAALSAARTDERARCVAICDEENADVDSSMYRAAASRIADRIRMEAP